MRGGPLLSALCVLALSAPASGAGAPIQTVPPIEIIEGSDPCALWETETEFTHFTYALKLEDKQVPMRVPSAWLCGGERKNGLKHEAQLFWVRLSDFTPLNCSPGGPSTGGRTLSILLSDVIAQTKMLRGPVGHAFSRPRPEYRRVIWHYGLDMHLGHINETRRDVFTSRSSQGREVIIDCGPEGASRRPNCRLMISVGDVDLQVGFDRTELPNWPRIRDRATRFISCAMAVE